MRKDKKFKDVFKWVIKHKKANHMTRGGLYEKYKFARGEFNTMPTSDYGCGKRSDYEIVKVRIGEAKVKTEEIEGDWMEQNYLMECPNCKRQYRWETFHTMHEEKKENA